MKLVLASRNQKKVCELETLLRQHTSMKIEVLSLDDIGYTENIVEDGHSFLENALLKASVPARLGYIGIADDSGLSVDALGGAPGIYSARYAGESASDAENNRKLQNALAEIPDAERGAAFVSVIACVFPREVTPTMPAAASLCRTSDGLIGFSVQGERRGVILRDGRGNDGFGYDPLFYVPEYGQTFAEMDFSLKNQISHRGNAMRVFCQAMADIFQNQ